MKEKEHHVVSPVLRTCIHNGNVEERYWDVSVPPKNSLSWSLTMSYFVLAHNEKNLYLLDKMTDAQVEMKNPGKNISFKSCITGKERIMEEWTEFFNPFKNRHKIFHLKAIKLYNQVLSKRIKSASSSYNESGFEGKLKAASKLLGCAIRVFNVEGRFLRETDQREYSELSNPSHSIILLRHYNGGSRRRKVTFHFTLSCESGNAFKLDALRHWLMKAEISPDVYQKIESDVPLCHGEGFLRFLFEKNLGDVITAIYNSPYIATGLSEAGFETCLTHRVHSKVRFKTASEDGPSNLCYALLQKDPKYVRILLHHAYDCRRQEFGKCVRNNPNKDGLETLEDLESMLETDKSMMASIDFDEDAKNACSFRLDYYIELLRYLIKLTKQLRELEKQTGEQAEEQAREQAGEQAGEQDGEQAGEKDGEQDGEQTGEQAEKAKLLNRKIIIYSENYLKYFYYKAENNLFLNYLKFYEHYQNIDYFTLTGFFDNFNMLKSLLKAENENVFSEFEWRILTYMLALKYWPLGCPVPRFNDENACSAESGIVDGNIILQRIPFSFREALKRGVSDISKSRVINKNLSEDGQLQSSTKYAILDELLLIRLSKYVSAVSEIMPKSMSRKDVLCIERTLQIIGESVKMNVGCVTNFLLSICLPGRYQQALKEVRNYLSHYRSNGIYGRAKLRLDTTFFEGVREEIISTWEWFKVVSILQSHRIKKALIIEYLSHPKIPREETKALQKEMMILKNQEREELKPHQKKLKIIILNAFENFRNRTKALNDESSNLKKSSSKQVSKTSFFYCVQNIVQVIEHGIEGITDSNEAEALNYIFEPVKKFFQSEDHFSWEQVCLCFERISMNWKNKICYSHIQVNLPFTESFVSKIVQANQFTDDEKKCLGAAAEKAYEESIKAHTKLLENLGKEEENMGVEEIDSLLHKLFMKEEKIENMKEHLRKEKRGPAIKSLNNYKHPNKGDVLEAVERILETKSMETGHALTILLKMTFRGTTKEGVYESATLPDDLDRKLANFVTQKASYFLDVLRDLKQILIDDDRDVRSIYGLGKSPAVRQYGKTLMRRKYMDEVPARASVEIGLLDCLNLLKRSGLEGKEGPFKRMFEKSSRLFAGINLRNMMAHNCAVWEAVGEMLDEADFPAEIIDKVQEFVDDISTINGLVRLFKASGKIEKESFKKFVENSADETISKMVRFKGPLQQFKKNWEKYIALIPFAG